MSTPDVAELTGALNKAKLADGSLPFTGALAGSAALSGLTRTYFADGTVTIADAKVGPGEDPASVVVSGKVVYGTVTCDAALVLTPAASDVSLVLTLTPAAGWTLPGLFPSVLDPTLSGLAFASGGLVICSAPYKEPSQHLTLARGMTLVAALDVAKSYPLLAEAFGTRPVHIHGLVTDPDLPQMTLNTVEWSPVGGRLPLADVTMTFTLGDLAAAGQQPISIASAGMRAKFALAKTIGGTVTASLPAAGSLLALDVAFDNANLGDLSLLEPYLGVAKPAAILPEEISGALTKAASAFQLTSLSLLVDTNTWKPCSAGIVVTVDLKGFGPFPALPGLKIGKLLIRWGINVTASPPAVTFTATADVNITPKCPVALGIQAQPGGGYLIFLSQQAGAALTVADLATALLPGFTMPERLAPDIKVTDLSVVLAPQDGLYTFAAAIAGSWPVLQRLGIELAAVRIEAVYSRGTTPPLSGTIAGVLQLEVPPSATRAPGTAPAGPGVDPPSSIIELDVSAARTAGSDGWFLTGQTGPGQAVPVGDLIAALAHKFGVPGTVPAAISTLTIQNLGVQFDTVSENFTFSCQLDVTIAGEPVDMVVTVSVTKAGSGYALDFGGTLLVGPFAFALHIDKNSDSTSIAAVYAPRPGDEESVSLHELVSYISRAAATTVPDLNVQLAGVKLVVVQPQHGPAEFALSLDLSASFGLSDLPLVGSALPESSVSIEHLQIMYSTANLTNTEAAGVNSHLPQGVSPLPAAGLSPGVSLAADLVVNGERTAITLGVPAGGASQPAKPALALPAAAAPAPPAQQPAPPAAAAPAQPAAAAPVSQPSAHWFDVQQSFGPVSIGRIGVAYQQGVLMFLIDASLSMGGLSAGLNGLGLGSPLHHFELTAHLDGLAISFSDGPVSISGGFLAVPSPPSGVTNEFMGELTIAAESFLISGIGAYATVHGRPSFFVFAEADGEFGGPPAFFVTGLMGGAGYNWTLALPPADRVYEFPFVAGLGNPSFFGTATSSPMPVLDVLSGQDGRPAWVTPSEGHNWLAAGLQFCSFELINGRALLVAQTGASFGLALLGLATVALPQGAAGDAYAYAELQLDVVLKPADGVFSAIASLTPKSYLLSRQCQLTGGFAFCLWYGPSPHAGDFVLTLGGYHPAFLPVKPAWYPGVPRVGFHWAVNDSVVIKGGAYFAVTPTAAMAGGSLEVLFHSGDLRAWLTAQVDVMIRWQPFYLTAGIGISVGVSYRLSAGSTSLVLEVELAAALNLWGPPTGGVAHIDWYIISFTVSFGAPRKPATDLIVGWDGFRALLPSPDQPAQAAAAAVPAAGGAGTADGQRQPVVLTISVSRGLAGTDHASGDWIVRTDELVLSAASAIPMTSVSFGRPVRMPAGAPAGLSIRPMGATGVRAAFSITVSSIRAGGNPTPVDLARWPEPQVQTSKLPEALWGEPLKDGEQPPAAANLIDHLPTRLVFAPPATTAGSSIGPLDVSSLVSPLGEGHMPLTPASQSDPIPGPGGGKGSIQEIASKVASPASLRAQHAIVTALGRYGAAPPTPGPLTSLGEQAGAVFTQPPMLAA